jgi:regulator of sirC expression with transglutaminase-like and TPR domain
MESGFAFPYRGRGLILLRQGKDAEAEKDFVKYLELFPTGKDSLAKEIEKIKEERSAKP